MIQYFYLWYKWINRIKLDTRIFLITETIRTLRSKNDTHDLNIIKRIRLRKKSTNYYNFYHNTYKLFTLCIYDSKYTLFRSFKKSEYDSCFILNPINSILIKPCELFLVYLNASLKFKKYIIDSWFALSSYLVNKTMSHTE